MTIFLMFLAVLALAVVVGKWIRWHEATAAPVTTAEEPATAKPSQGSFLTVGKTVKIPVKTSAGMRLMNGTLVRTNMVRAWVRVHIRPGVDAVVRRRLRFVRVAT